jgi:uncharacterized protein YdiU (UPF0061 family)
MQNSLKNLKNLIWKATFTNSLPGDPIKENFSRKPVQALHSRAYPVITPDLRPVIISVFVASLIGLEKTEIEYSHLHELQQHLQEISIEPWAARYTGHQFGYILDQLGDGRAITLGEVETPSGTLYDFQLKGAGRTPYSRVFDGKATLRSSLREFIGAEAIRSLGISTTHILGVFSTGEQIKRDPSNQYMPKLYKGAMAIRIAQSLVRFGHFDLCIVHKTHDLSKQLLNYVVGRHFPDKIAENHAKVIFENAVEKTAAMIAQWMAVGFCHGVMNTDNMSILGETLDFGPYGFLEEYRPDWTPNTTDNETLRYSYGNQPQIGFWNLGILAQGLEPLLDDPLWVQSKLDSYWPIYKAHYNRLFSQKIGFEGETTPEILDAIEALTQAMEYSHVDFTIFFREFSHLEKDAFGNTDRFLDAMGRSFYDRKALEQQKYGWDLFLTKFRTACDAQKIEFGEERRQKLLKTNPKFIPRNWMMDSILDEAEAGDFDRLNLLHKMVLNPFDETGVPDEYYRLQSGWRKFHNTVSQLSCAS